MEKTLPASEARQIFAEIVDRANFAAERFLIVKNGKDAAVLIGVNDYAFLKALETEFDLNRAKEVSIEDTHLKKLTRQRPRHSERDP